MDARRAVQWARANADRLGINPSRIGVMGFSAGGYLAASVSTVWTDGDAGAPDPVARSSSRPDFSVLVYPALAECHLADISKDTSPAFVALAGDDFLDPDRALAYAQALHEAGVPVELHFFTEGGHGGGLGILGGPFAAWPGLLANWLERLTPVLEEQAIRASGKLTHRTPLSVLAANERAAAVLARVVPNLPPQRGSGSMSKLSLAQLAAWDPEHFPEELLRRLDAELAKL